MKDPYAGVTAKIVILCEAQNWRCCYCGVVMVRGEQGPDSASVEHVVPRVAGGAREWENEVAACKLCNESRGAMYARQYFQMVQWKGREKAVKWARRRVAKRRADKFAGEGKIIGPQFGGVSP